MHGKLDTDARKYATGKDHRVQDAQRDVITGTVIFAAILLFVSTGSTILTDTIRAILGGYAYDNNLLASALLLNIALILFGWRRYRDLTDEVRVRTEAEQRARLLADTDPLTGFYNRRAFADRSAALIAHAEAEKRTVACLMIDLDNFKTINDVHGHSAGDAVLCEVASRFREIAPEPNVLARLGGDEFAFLFSVVDEKVDTVERICENLIRVVCRPIMHDGSPLTVTPSIGITLKNSSDDSDADALMGRADIAMYSAKRQGRCRFCWFDSSMQAELRTRSQLESAMRLGISRGEFIPYYEKQVDLETGELLGFEMLTRWISPEHGMISPEIFIPIAEDTGLIGDLSLSMIRQAFNEARDWNEKLTLSVNISPVQLHDPWLAQKIVKALVETNYPPERLEIDITESSLFENLDLAQSTIGSLKNQGIHIALDDFGTGYSSLAHLRALPFDCIKIDRSFVSSINRSSDSDAIVRSIISLGSSLNIPVTAEGVEDEAIAKKLREIGCNKGQGFYFGRPKSPEEVRKLLQAEELWYERQDCSETQVESEQEAIEPVQAATAGSKH